MTPEQLAAIAARDEKPERTWIDWPQPNATGLAFSCQARPPALRTEYVRADLVDAEVARLTAALTEAEKRHVDLHRLAYSWMVAHDKLNAGKPYAFPSPLEPDAITKLETTAYQHGYDAAKEQAMQAVEDAGWYRSSDDAVSWDAQDEQVQYSIAAIAAMVKP